MINKQIAKVIQESTDVINKHNYLFEMYKALIAEDKALDNNRMIDISWGIIENIIKLSNDLLDISNNFKLILKTKYLSNYQTNLVFFDKITFYSIDIEDNEFKLSHRQLQCAQNYAEGHSMKEIAKNLNLSPRTVEEHLSRVKQKTGISYKNEIVKLFKKSFSYKN